MSIKEYLSKEHQHCDNLFAMAEEKIAEGDWNTGSLFFNDFYNALTLHFQKEEELLFPAFEQVSGNECGPTKIMLSEHAQFRTMIDQLKENVASTDQEGYMGNSETLFMLMQQHNAKEEQMLYTMADQLIPDTESLINKMEEITN